MSSDSSFLFPLPVGTRQPQPPQASPSEAGPTLSSTSIVAAGVVHMTPSTPRKIKVLTCSSVALTVTFCTHYTTDAMSFEQNMYRFSKPFLF